MNVRTVHVAVYDTWADWEAGHLMARVNNPVWQREPGSLRTRTVGRTTDPVTSMGGLRITPDLAVDDLDPADSAMLVLPGADLFDTEGAPWAAEAARRFLRAGVPVAAICGATLGLAQAGLLDDRAHTSADAAYLAASGYAGAERYVEAEAVVDRGLITAGPVDALPFTRAALELLGVYDPTVLDAWYRLFAEHDPSGFGVLAGAS